MDPIWVVRNLRNGVNTETRRDVFINDFGFVCFGVAVFHRGQIAFKVSVRYEC